MPLLNTIGIAGLVWCISFHVLQVHFSKDDTPEISDKEMVDDTSMIMKLSLIPAVFAALASL